MTNNPVWLAHARAELGVHETPGPVSTKRILEYRTMAGLRIGGDDGVVPWCAIFVNAMLALSNIKGSGSAMARSFTTWGQRVDQPFAGAVVPVKSAIRPAPAGHVTIATGRVTATYFEGCGGNQGDAVSLAWFPLANALGFRWPPLAPLPTIAPIPVDSHPSAMPVKDI